MCLLVIVSYITKSFWNKEIYLSTDPVFLFNFHNLYIYLTEFSSEFWICNQELEFAVFELVDLFLFIIIIIAYRIPTF